MALYSRDSIERLRDAIDMVDLVSTRTELRRVGSQWSGRCPFHDDRRPSLSVNAASKVFHCFGCDAQGDAFGFVVQSEGVPFREAVELLADRYGVHPDFEKDTLQAREPRRPRAVTTSSPPRSRAPEQTASAHRALDGYVEHCHRRLMTRQGYSARRWLYARGLTDAEIVAHRIGYDPGYRALGRARRAPPAVTLPLLDESGEVVYAQGRLLRPPPDAPKFLNPSSEWIGRSPRISAVRSPPTADRSVLVLCEGLCDGILAGRCFETRALIGAGQSDDAVTDRLATVAGDRPVVVCFDSDSTGRLSASKVVARLAERGVRSASVALPAEDVTDLRLDAGERFEQVLRGLVSTAVERAHLEHVAGRANATALDPLEEHGHLLGLRRLELVRNAVREGFLRRDELSAPFQALNADDALEFLRIERRRSVVTTLIEADRREATELVELARSAAGPGRSRYEELARLAYEFIAEDESELAQLDRGARRMRRDGRDLDTWLNANLADVKQSVATERAYHAPRARSVNGAGFDVGF